jgi:hypothetical protein
MAIHMRSVEGDQNIFWRKGCPVNPIEITAISARGRY